MITPKFSVLISHTKKARFVYLLLTIVLFASIALLNSCNQDKDKIECTFQLDSLCYCKDNVTDSLCLKDSVCSFTSDSLCFCKENPGDSNCLAKVCTYEDDPVCYCENNPGDVFCEFGEPLNVSPVERYGQIKVEGNKVLDNGGNPVQLQGMSFFWSQWIGKYYNKEAVKWLKDDWRATVVRAAMAVEPDGYLANREAEKQKIKAVVDAAIEAGLYVIIDWHDHHAENHIQEAKIFFAEMAQTYGDKPNVIYEVYNEPLNVSWQEVLKPYHQALIDTIRRYDPDNLIACSTPNWSQDIDKAANDPLTDKNVVYTLHYYAATHKQYLRDRALQALNKGIAIAVTEYGTCEASGSGYLDVEESKKWWKFMNDHKILSCNWSIADKVETAAALKPGASATGNWGDSEISPSGLLVRSYLRARNPKN